MLSAMVQAQAAIIAIVITLTLIAVQLTASAYSPRVIRVFRDNPDMWLLLGFYGFSMLYGLVVLKMVVGGAREVVSQDVFWVLGYVPLSFECCVSLAYWLEVFTFVALFPYMLNIIGLLKPENIIKRLAIEITNDKILKSEEDLIQPIMDIIHSSVMKYDLETTRVGLKAVTDRMIRIIGLDFQKEDVQKESSSCHITFEPFDLVIIGPDEESTEEVIEKIDRKKRPVDTTSHLDSCFFEFFRRVGRLTVSKMDEESTREVIKNLYNFGRLSSENGLDDETWSVAESLGFIGKLTAEKGKEFEEVTSQAVWFLIDVGRIASKSELENATEQTAKSLGIVGEIAAEKGLEDVTSRVVLALRKGGGIAAEKGLKNETEQTAESLCIVGKTAAESGLEDVTEQAVLALKFVVETAAESGLEDATEQAVCDLGDVGTAAAEKGLESAALEAAWALRTVGEIAAEKGLEGGTMEAVLSLIRIGRITAEKGLEDATKIVVRSLAAVGTIAIEKELEFSVAREAVWFIEGLTISIEEIPDYDHDSPQKFMNLYKQRFEKLRELRTQKPDRPPHK